MTDEVWDYHHKRWGTVRGVPVGEDDERVFLRLVRKRTLWYHGGKRRHSAGDVVRLRKVSIKSRRRAPVRRPKGGGAS